jgi:hypothetical protein
MTSIRPLACALALWAGLACDGSFLSPSPNSLAGRWSTPPEQLNPTGSYVRTIEFSTEGKYVSGVVLRGTYAQLPADSAGSWSRTYGTYVLRRDTLLFAPDSARSWDWMTGEHFQTNFPTLIYIEGPPTPPVVTVTRTRLTMRYLVNPGNGYQPVVLEYSRDP